MLDESHAISLPEAPRLDRSDRILAALAAKPDGVLESIARELSVSTQTVLEMTPENEKLLVPAHCFDEIWREISK